MIREEGVVDWAVLVVIVNIGVIEVRNSEIVVFDNVSGVWQVAIACGISFVAGWLAFSLKAEWWDNDTGRGIHNEHDCYT